MERRSMHCHAGPAPTRSLFALPRSAIVVDAPSLTCSRTVTPFSVRQLRRIGKTSVGRQGVLVVCSTGTSASADRAVAWEAADKEHSPLGAPPKRVLIFVEPSPFTYVCGYKNRFCNTIKYLVEEGCEVLVVTTGRGLTLPGRGAAFRSPPSDYHGARVCGVLSVGCPFYWAMPISAALSPRVWSQVRRFKPDLIHCSSPGVMVAAAALFSRLLAVPLVLSYHTHLPQYLPKYRLGFLVGAMWAVIRFIHSAAHLTLTTSPALREQMIRHARMPPDKVKVWRKAVDTDDFNPAFRNAAMRERLSDGHPAAPLLVYIGRLGSEKNLAFFKPLLERLPGCRLALVGDGPERRKLESLLRGMPVHFAGMLTGRDLSEAYASADVFVMPSESETLGFVVLEAMSSGLPVVAVKAGGIPDIITRPGTNGLLFEPGDVDSAADMVRRLAADTGERERLGGAGRAEVEKWDWRSATRHLLAAQYSAAAALAALAYGARAAAAAGGEGSSGGGGEWDDVSSSAQGLSKQAEGEEEGDWAQVVLQGAADGTGA